MCGFRVVSLNLVDIAFFTKICESGIEEAKRAFSVSDAEVSEMLSSVQSFVGDSLFKDGQQPSYATLSKKGMIFFPSAKKMVEDILSDSLKTQNFNEDQETVVRVKSDILNGKNIVLPSITSIEESSKSEAEIKLFTSENYKKWKSLDMHVIFHNMEKADKLFFTKKWSVKIPQHLYASKKYLQESGNVPKAPKDLLQHAILGLGDTFDQDVYTYTNWYLSGKYLGINLVPAMMINSRSVLKAAISAHLGIGPILEYKNVLENCELCKILPDIEGPHVVVDFAIRKNINKVCQVSVMRLEKEMLSCIESMGLEVIY